MKQELKEGLQAHPGDTITLNWVFLLILGMVVLLAGLLALLLPVVAGLALGLLLAFALLVHGSALTLHALHMGKRRGFMTQLVCGLLAIGLGIALLLQPSIAAASLALLVSLFFLMSGCLKSILAWQLRPMWGWKWLLFSGCASFAVGIFLLVAWPEAAAALLGILVGIELMFGGWWIVLTALSARQWHLDNRQP